MDAYTDPRILYRDDDNIGFWRERYPGGLHFAVGDTHGEWPTVQALLKKIRFDPERDHLYFLGDYNAGGDVRGLLTVLAEHYRADLTQPGIHLIRGNHERELYPIFPLENLPDVIALRGSRLHFFLAHAGMTGRALELFSQDLSEHEEGAAAYCLDERVAGETGILRQVVWSKNGLYSHRSNWPVWPSEKQLLEKRAFILHGHTPFCMLRKRDRFSYGDRSLLIRKQRVWFSEDLQSMDLDSNLKGRYDPEDAYRGLTCVCLEALEAAADDTGTVTAQAFRETPNGVYGVRRCRGERLPQGSLMPILTARPKMKTVTLDEQGRLILR